MNVKLALSSLAVALTLGMVAGLASAATGYVEDPAAAPVVVREHDDGTDRDKEHFRVGALGGFGFPRPLAIEGLVKIERILSLGVEYSFLPEMTFSDVHTSLWAIAADARFFPFGSIFFVGARIGEQHLSGSGSFTASGIGTIGETLTVDTWFVSPRIGLLWTAKPGITIGIDAGLQIPLSTSESSTLPPSLLASAPPSVVSGANSITSVTDYLGKSTIPAVDLLQIGVLF